MHRQSAEVDDIVAGTLSPAARVAGIPLEAGRNNPVEQAPGMGTRKTAGFASGSHKAAVPAGDTVTDTAGNMVAGRAAGTSAVPARTDRQTAAALPSFSSCGRRLPLRKPEKGR